MKEFLFAMLSDSKDISIKRVAILTFTLLFFFVGCISLFTKVNINSEFFTIIGWIYAMLVTGNVGEKFLNK